VDRERLRRRIGANPIARLGYKAMIVARSRGALRQRPRDALRYVLHSREASNFTYELSNEDEMVATLGEVLPEQPVRLMGYVDELHGDVALRDSLAAKLRANPGRDPEPRYGKRAMDYCIVRARRPGAVLELGTHDGFGAAVILRALERNAEDGFDGKLVSLDAGEQAGWLVPDFLRARLTQIAGDVRQTLEPALREHGADYVNSDIAPDYPDKEWALETICAHARGELLIRDEVDEGSALQSVAKRHDARYFTFREQPIRHFFPGHLIGLGLFGSAG
jgi:methyltransferase family protein